MANQDAAETAKEILRQIIKYRFWIAVGFAALFAVIAYYMGAGPVQQKTTEETNTITGAEKGVEAYQSRDKPTPQYEPIVLDKTKALTQDVNKAWKELYDRQAPLLTWPEYVQARFRKWGRQWPESEDAGRVNVAIIDYIEAYKSYVDMVYATFHPFNYESGEGIVAAPTKEELLRTPQFSVEKPPTLGKVWAAQERLWIQRALLEVVAEVNRKAGAKDWDTAAIKEIEELEVGSPDAMDQRSLADGKQPEEAPDVMSPAQKAAADAASSSSGAGAGASPAESMTGMSAMAGRMGGRPDMGAMGGGGASAAASDSIYYINQGATQYRVLPISMQVLIDQDRVQDFLVELENSPMSIQVMDFELERPSSRVTKPEKGEQRASMAGMGGMGGMGGMMRGMMMTQGFGGMASQMRMSMRGGMGGMEGMMGGMGGMMGGPSGGASAKKKVDVSGVDRKKAREKQESEIAEKKGPTLFDPYFNIVEVTVYGQARFFLPPPTDAELPSTSPGETQAAGTTAPAGAATSEKGAPSTEKTATPEKAAPTAEKAATAEKPAPTAEKTAPTPNTSGAAPTPAKGETPAAAAPKAGEPAPKAGEPAPKAGEPAPKAGEPAPKAGEPAPKAGEAAAPGTANPSPGPATKGAPARK